MVLPDPPSYRSESSIERRSSGAKSDSFAQSATNVLAKVLSNVSIGTEVPYRVDNSEILCSICLEAMDEEEGNLFTVSSCSHTFHIDCIAKWKEMSRKCPCCRGELPEEIDPTLSKLQNLPSEEVAHNMTSSDIFRKITFSLLGIVYPLFLFSLFLTLGAICFAPAAILFLCTVATPVCEDGACFSFPLVPFIVISILSCTLFLTVAVGAFILLIIYTLYRTLKFYAMVFMCKMRWSDAYGFIFNRAITLTTHILDNLDSELLLRYIE